MAPPGTYCSGGSQAHFGCPDWVGSADCKNAADTVGCRNGGSAHASEWSPAASPDAYRRGTGQPEGVDQRRVSPTSLKQCWALCPGDKPWALFHWEPGPARAPSPDIGHSPAVSASAPPTRCPHNVPYCAPHLTVPQQVLALAVLATEVPGAAIQLLGDPTLAGLGAVSTSDTAQPQLLREVLFVQQHAAWGEGKREESGDTEMATGACERRPLRGRPSKSPNSFRGPKPSEEPKALAPQPSGLPCQPLGR